MKDDRGIEDRLTPSARAALDSYLNDTRAEILNEANAISASLSDYPEIGVSEILQAVRGQQGQREGDRIRASELSASRLRLLTAMTASLGAVLIAVAAAVFTIQLTRSSGSPAFSGVAVFTSAGLSLFTIGLSFYYLSTTRRRYRLAEESSARQEQRSLGEFLVRWNEFNRAVDGVVASRFGESAASPGLGKKLSLLDRNQILSPEDAFEVKRLFDMRNRLVHGTSGDQPSQQQLQVALGELTKLYSKLAQAGKSDKA